jgi:hypothetical protein
MRTNNVADEVEANLERKQRKAKQMADKAKAQSKKMNKMDAAIEATLADSHDDLNDELASFGRVKTTRLKYLQEQFKTRKLLRNGLYLTIAEDSPFRSTYCTLLIKAVKRVIPAGRLLRNLTIWKTASLSSTTDTKRQVPKARRFC